MRGSMEYGAENDTEFGNVMLFQRGRRSGGAHEALTKYDGFVGKCFYTLKVHAHVKIYPPLVGRLAKEGGEPVPFAERLNQ